MSKKLGAKHNPSSAAKNAQEEIHSTKMLKKKSPSHFQISSTVKTMRGR
jgi:hypothetical protein